METPQLAEHAKGLLRICKILRETPLNPNRLSEACLKDLLRERDKYRALFLIERGKQQVCVRP